MSVRGSITGYLRNRFNKRNNTQAAVRAAKKYLGTNSTSKVYSWAATQLMNQGPKPGLPSKKAFQKEIVTQKNIGERAKANYQAQIQKIRTADTQALTKARRAARLAGEAQKIRADMARKIASDLAASDARIAARQKREVELFLLTSSLTPQGRKYLRNLETNTKESLLKKIDKSPFSKDYKRKISAKIASLAPGGKRGRKEQPKYSVTVQGQTYKTNDKKQYKYLSALKRTINRDQRFKEDFNEALRVAGAEVKKDDKLSQKAFKGAKAAGLAFLFSGRFIANAADKAVATTAGLLTRKSRQDVLRELGRAAKETPKAVATSLDPRKPENWATIAIVALAVVGKGYQARQANKGLATAKKTLSKVRKAKVNARKASLKSAAAKRSYKKLIKAENGLKRLVKTYENRQSLPSKLLKVKTKPGKVANVKTKTVAVSKKVKPKPLKKERNIRINKFRKQLSPSYLRKIKGYTRKQQITAQKALRKAVSKDVTRAKTNNNPSFELDIIGKKPVVKMVNTGRGKGLRSIKKPSFKKDIVSVDAGNGQKVLLLTKQKLASTTRSSTIAKTITNKKIKTYVVPKVVLKQSKVYYKEVLATARTKKPLRIKNSTAKKLNKVYGPLFATGSISGIRKAYDIKLAVSPFSKVGVASQGKTSTILRSGTIAKTSTKSLQQQQTTTINKLSSLLATRTLTRNKVNQVQKLLERLLTIRQRLKRVKRLPRPIIRRRKVKPSKSFKLSLDELYTKTNKKYRPSLAAIIFGIYGYKPKTITGFELRPLLKKRTVKKVGNTRRKKRTKTSNKRY